ncbi:thioredoxin family protein, partial [Candidatus Woesearchaeota archaeon]|nr:thioredoxin family protein [Candidatus Woesearchaeota archaeon]
MGLKIGDGIVPFKLTAVDGKEYSDGFFRKKLLLVVFTCNHCPYAEAYEERIKQIQEEFEDELDVVGINSNDDVGYPEDSFEKMIERARDAEFNFYY